jgi:uncharacterized protein (TIGR00369 family)
VSETAPEQGTKHPQAENSGTHRQRTFTWDDPTSVAGAAAGLSGMEFFAEIEAGRIPMPPIMRVLDFENTSYSEGHITFRLVPQEFHYNTLGTMHGGVFAALLDTVCGCSVHTSLPRGHFYTSLDLSVKFLRPVTMATGPITAEGEVVHIGRRTALAAGRVIDTAGKLYATATSSCLVMRPE